MTYEEWGELLKQTGDAEDFQPLSIDKLYADWTADREKIEQMQRVIDELAIGNRDAVYQRRHRKYALKQCRTWPRYFCFYKDDAVRFHSDRADAAEAEVEKWKDIAQDFQNIAWDAENERDKLAEKIVGLRSEMAEMVPIEECIPQQHYDDLAERVQRLEGGIRMALSELGVPNEGYPSPVCEAIEQLRAALDPKEEKRWRNDWGCGYVESWIGTERQW